MSLSADLPGTWLLRSRVDVSKTGEPHPDPLLGEDAVALLIYDKNNTQAQGGYDAYFGTYSVDDVSGTVTQQLIGSLSPGTWAWC